MFLKPSQPAFGLDIGDLSLKLFQLQKRKGKITPLTYNKIKVPEGFIEKGGIKNPDGVLKLIEKLIKESPTKINTDEVITSLPETKTFLKIIEIPAVAEKEIPKSVAEEIGRHLPLSLEEIYFDWQIIEQKEGRLKILFGGAPRPVVDQYTELLEKAKLIPIILETESAAITRSLINERIETEPVAIIDFGATRTSLIIYDQQTIQFTTGLPIAGDNITKIITETLKLTPSQAEKAKITCGLDREKCKGALREILFSAIEELAKKIKESLLFYQNDFPDKQPIKKILLCGGGANFIEIDGFLSRRLGLAVTGSNPWINIKSEKPLPEGQLLTYTTAIGLALRGLQEI